MRLSRNLIGKVVEIEWMDPTTCKFKSHTPEDKSSLPKGRAALATWTEYGLLDDVTDGVVRLLQSIGTDAVVEKERVEDYTALFVPEALIEKVTVLIPSVEPTASS